MSTKLLLADDSATIQRVIGLTFAGHDVEVIVAADGEEAIARIALEKPDIVLADIGMPKRSGYDVSAFVKSHPELRSVPVVLLAGAFEPVDDVRAREVRCDGVLVKPLEPQQVISTVHQLIDRAQAAPRRAPDGHLPHVGEPTIVVHAPAALDTAALLDPGIHPVLHPVSQRVVHPVLDAYVAERVAIPVADIGFTADAHGGRAMPELRLASDLADPFLIEQSDRDRLARPSSVADYVATERGATHAEPPLDDLLSGVTLPDLSLVMPVIPADGPPVALPTVSVPPMPVAPMPVHPGRSAQGHDMPAARDVVATANSTRSVMARAFETFFAVENGEAPDTTPLRLDTFRATPVITDAMVDDLVTRVLARLSDRSSEHVNEIVRRVVADVAERLVRDEIERMR